MSISWHERKKTTVLHWSVVNYFSLVIINVHPPGKGQKSCVRSNLDYYQGIYSTAFTFDYLLEKSRYLNVDVVIKKSLFLPSVLKWRNTRKRKPWTLSFIEEAWICRTGPIFSVFWSNGSKRESTVKCHSRSKEGKKITKKHRCPYAHKDRETTKNILRIVNS